jgi:gamma-glutamyltranspeptidase/glutathione hydrolase
VEKLAYADRAAYLGDADYYPVPVDHLLSSDYIALRAGGIDLEHATPSRSVTAGPGPPTRTETRIQDIRGSPPVGDSQESPETTHFSIVDRDGNAVSCTTTLNGRFGSCVVAAGTGVLLNNEMDDFSMKPGVPNIYGLVGGEANAIEPEKRMLSSMTPTIVLGHGDAGGRSMGTEERARDEAPYEHRDDEQRDHDNRNADSRHADDHDADSGAEKESYVELVLGSPGGSTIITTVLQVILNVLVHDLSLEEAVAVPRFHHQWLPDETRVESGGIPEGVLEDLEKMGHVIIEVEALGDIHAVMVLGQAQAARVEGAPGTSWEPAEDYTGDAHDQEAPLLIGVSDPRRGGTAIGY